MIFHSKKREEKEPLFFLIPYDVNDAVCHLVKDFPSHWKAKEYAKKHGIQGWVARELGYSTEE